MKSGLEGASVMRYYVTSDTHGFYTPLVDALKKAGYFEDTSPHKLMILGDLFDRGMEAVKLQEFVLDLMTRDEIILIRGNHEDLFEELVTEDSGAAYSYHVSNGTYETALRLTDYDLAMAAIRRYDFAEAGQKTPYFTKIIPTMLDYYETEHYIFTHGWIPCVEERSGQLSYYGTWRQADRDGWRKARWYNGMMAAKTARADKTVVCGHWHASFGHSNFEHKGSEFGADADFTPYYGGGVIAIDACTAHTGFVNCIVIDEE